VLVAAKIAGFENTSLYDGSWSEWAADEKNEIVI
jgi:3-mercaptopyruvate sulfurtransferase SseA